MASPPNIPSIHSLYNERMTKEQQKQNIFNIVLNKCVEKILYTNRHSDQTYIIFEVPKILIGFPSYDMKSCLLFLIKKLAEHSYKVEFIEPFYLYIDWGSTKATATPQAQKTFESKIVKDKIAVDQPRAEKLKTQTKKLLSKFPNTSKVVYVYSPDGPMKTPKQNPKKKK
jgi:hypothetical protein